MRAAKNPTTPTTAPEAPMTVAAPVDWVGAGPVPVPVWSPPLVPVGLALPLSLLLSLPLLPLPFPLPPLLPPFPPAEPVGLGVPPTEV